MMDRETRHELLVLGAGLLGVATGTLLRDRRARSDQPPVQGQQLMVATVPSLIAARQLADRVGDALDLAPGASVPRAALAFSTGAILTYFAELMTRFGPGLAPGRQS